MDYIEFFEKIKKFKLKQEKQKQRGLNDFNLLSTVRKYHDEVYLHSTMIGALLNPNGLHYQNTLFLEKFFEILKLQDFDFTLESTSVYVEYHDIDLYFTDGNRHIIIENKIWAKDQPCQIIKYINIIKEEYNLVVDNSNKIAKIDDIFVLYLTPNNKIESHEHKVENGFISFSGEDEKLDRCSKREATKRLVPNGLKNYQVKYKKINYKEDILNWLSQCQHEVQNITNLNEAIRQYKDVVKMVNNNYKEKVVELSEELKKKEFFEIAYDVNSEFPKACAKLELEFWNMLIDKIENIEGYQGIINKSDKQNKIAKERLSKDNVFAIRQGAGKNNEIHLYFEILKKKVMLLVGTSNSRNYIYAVVYKHDWEQVDISDNGYIEKIEQINISKKFERKKWCFSLITLDDMINLRGKELINASKHVDELAVKIEDLIKDLKSITLEDIEE